MSKNVGKIRRIKNGRLKTIAAASVKETTPEFSVGDTVKVSVNIREGEEKESRCLRVLLLLKEAVA